MTMERKFEVLRAIIEDYVQSGEPVASKSIAGRQSFNVSAATIRNDMAQLEEENLIIAPHTSAGRIPTDKGYRVFVDQISELKPLTQPQKQAIEAFLQGSESLDEVLNRTVRLLSQLTNQVALIQYPTFGTSRVRHIELIELSELSVLVVLITDNGRVEQRILQLTQPAPEDAIRIVRSMINEKLYGLELQNTQSELRALAAEFPHQHQIFGSLVIASLLEQIETYRKDRLMVSGAANLAKSTSDFSGSLFSVLDAIEEQAVLLKLFTMLEHHTDGLATRIGRENAQFGLEDTSVIAGQYTIQDGIGSKLGVLGPTRMNYSHNLATVQAVAQYLTKLFGENN